MPEPVFQPDFASTVPMAGEPLIDPHRGDVEDDGSSTKRRSLLAIAGTLLAEISVPKLVFAVAVSVLLPAALLGLAPLVASAWFVKLSGSVAELTEMGAALFLLALLAAGWVGWRPFSRTVEANFWALNALLVQPVYAIFREALRHVAERACSPHDVTQLARLRAASSAGAGIVLGACAALIAALVWPASRWLGTAADLLVLHRLIVPMFANAAVVMSCYPAGAALLWGVADASMDQPLNLVAFDTPFPGGRLWRIAHLSDIHVVGERYGFRIESGRSGPRGNERVEKLLACIAAVDATRPLDLILISGDMTDAGRSTEWAEFLDAVALHPGLAGRMLVLPGNHDVNIVDRANPARLDLPFSPGKRLRQMRALSAMVALQGDRVRVIDPASGKPERTLSQTLAPHRRRIAEFANAGGLSLSAGLGRIWHEQFPMILPPGSEHGLGVVMLNSNAETHFSFTNALGMIPVEQARRLKAVLAGFSGCCWIIALHHHLVEYPMRVTAFSERVGTALINGSWFLRKIKPFADRAVVMHGHRHIDWIGACGRLRVISAPSPVMGATDVEATHFYVHTLCAGPDGQLRLLPPERVEVEGGPLLRRPA